MCAVRQPLLERDAELAELGEAARRAGGEGSLLFVGGEAGVGKTALVRHFVASCEGTRVLIGMCDPLGTPRPLGPVLEMAPGLGPEFEERVAAAVGDQRAPAERAVAGELFTAFTRGLALSEGKGRPPVVVFEDVHWADQATLDLLRFVGRRADALPALLIATYREEEAAPGGPLAVLLGDLATAPGVRRLRLAPLSLEATERLAAGSGADARELHRRCGGNPFFITEALAAGGDALPATVRDVVLSRVARLSAAARASLEAAAAFGTRVAPESLAAVLDATGTPRWGAREAALAGLLVWQGSRLAFRHELAQAAIAGATSPERAQRLHAVILELLRREPPGAVDRAELVRHAEAAGDDRAVLELAPPAAERAEGLSAHREAAALWGKTLARARDLPDAARAVLTERRAHQCYLAGQLDEAIAGHRAAAALWRRTGDGLGEGRNLGRVASLAFLAGRYGEVEPALEAALARLEGLPPSSELAMAYEVRARLRFMAVDPAGAAQWADRADALATGLGDAATALGARVTAAAARLLGGDEGARADLDAGRREALERGMEDLAARAMAYLCWLPTLHRRYDVEREFDEGLAYTRDHDLGYWSTLISGARVMWCLDVGRWREVEGPAREILRHPRPISLSRMHALLALGRLLARRGEPEGRRHLDEARAMAAEHPRVAAVVPLWPALAEAGWLTGERAAVQEAVRAGGVQGPWAEAELAFWAHVVGEPVDPPTPLAEPYRLALAGEWVAASEWWLRRGCPYDAALALSFAGDQDAVLRAVAVFDGLGARPAAAHARQRLRWLGTTVVPRGPRPTTSANPAGLTRREQEVLGLVSSGLTNAQIASRLFLSEKTVERHLGAILRKLDAPTRGAAVEAAQRRGALPV
jgi:DNA-binding CsgD family transcriptional regulator